MNFDAPTEVGPQGYDFAPITAKLKQQRALADMLRKQNYAEQPEGSMVGNRYVAPSITQRLAPIVGALGSAYSQNQANTGEQDFARQTGAAARAWQGGLPQATAPTQDPPQDIGGNMIQGPVMPGSMPSRASVLQATMRGLQIPGNENAAMLWNKGMGEEITREDTQAAHKEDTAARMEEHNQTRMAQLQFQREQLEAQMQDKNQSREQLAAYQKMHDATLRAIAAGTAASQKYAADAAHSGVLVENSKEARSQLQHLSTRAENTVPAVALAQKIQDMLDGYGEKSIPGIGMITGTKYATPFQGLEATRNKQLLTMFANAVMRDQAGLSQTMSEAERVELELMRNGTFREKQFRAIWPQIVEKVNAHSGGIRAGFDPMVVETFNKRTGGHGLNPVRSKPKGLTPAEQAELDDLRKGP